MHFRILYNTIETPGYYCSNTELTTLYRALHVGLQKTSMLD